MAEPLPAWVIVGVPHPEGGVALVASDQLVRSVNLAMTSPYPGTPIALDLLMRSYLWVPGDTYAEALRRLFAAWSPDEPQPMRPLERGR
jgi:hypothetical protein